MEENKTRAEKKREQRLLNKIFLMLKNYRCLFITMTFSDHYLKTTNEETRKRYIKDYLNKESALYIANKDYGAKNNREHYHALIIVNTMKKQELKSNLKAYKDLLNLKAYKYGNINAKQIGLYRFFNDANKKQTALYLKDHFLKETTSGNIIVSRKEPNKKDQVKRIYDFIKTLKPKATKQQSKYLSKRQIIEDALNLPN